MTAMRGPLGMFGGHLGSAVSALVDGQLDDETAERAWLHVQHCATCRGLVEHEGWVKTRVAQMGAQTGTETGARPGSHDPSERLVGSLLDLDPASVAWAETRDLERRGRGRRRAGLVLVGAGSVSAAVFGLSTLGGAPMGIGGSTGSPASSLGGGVRSPSSTTATPTAAVVAPAASVHGRLRGWTWGVDDDGVAHARTVGAHH